MVKKKLELYVIGDDSNKILLIPSRLSKPDNLDTIIEPKISNFSLPSIVSNYWSNPNEEFEKRDRVNNLADFHVITPTFFQRDGTFKLKGELPRRSILLPYSREISNEELNNKFFRYLKRYSDLAQRWAPVDIFDIDGYSLDFKIVIYKNENDILLEGKPNPTIILRCGVNYYLRK
ncbi:MAG: hypothetical protein LAT82_04360 [Nanoarchaeota archaeon]|nr:hypothetical protein [Nanoarchaeota archaeon]